MRAAARIEEIFWTCECGTAMALELPINATMRQDLICRHCGIVATAFIRVGPPSLTAPRAEIEGKVKS